MVILIKLNILENNLVVNVVVTTCRMRSTDPKGVVVFKQVCNPTSIRSKLDYLIHLLSVSGRHSRPNRESSSSIVTSNNHSMLHLP